MFTFAPHMTSANNRARTAIGIIQTLQLLLFSVLCVHRECVIVLSGVATESR